MKPRSTSLFVARLLVICAVGFFAISCREPRVQGANASQSTPAADTRQRSVPERDDVLTQSLFRNIVKRENPVVVSITAQSHVRAPDSDEFSGGDDFFRRFFGAPESPHEEVQRALGSGLIGSGGEILTNHHVVAGAEQIQVGLFNDEHKTYVAKVIGRDPLTDSALLKLENGPSSLPTATLGDSNAIESGDWVVAIGNPFRLGHTVTVGVVSYKARPFAVTEGRSQTMLQTDASINPGNSGGPLLNTRGEVIGMNTAILSRGGEGNIGIGFAVPINAVKTMLPQLRQGHVHRGRLGVEVQTPSISDDEAKSLGLPKAEGAIVSMVDHDSPAERGGLRAGDVIVEYNGKPVTDGSALTAMVIATPGGAKVPLVFYRNGHRQASSVTIEELNLDEQNNRTTQQPTSSRTTAGFGVSLGDLSPDIARLLRLPTGTDGALVESVEPFTPAAEAGVSRGDVIVEVNRRPVHSATDAARRLGAIKSGQAAFLLLSRRGNQVFVGMRHD